MVTRWFEERLETSLALASERSANRKLTGDRFELKAPKPRLAAIQPRISPAPGIKLYYLISRATLCYGCSFPVPADPPAPSPESFSRLVLFFFIPSCYLAFTRSRVTNPFRMHSYGKK